MRSKGNAKNKKAQQTQINDIKKEKQKPTRIHSTRDRAHTTRSQSREYTPSKPTRASTQGETPPQTPSEIMEEDGSEGEATEIERVLTAQESSDKLLRSLGLMGSQTQNGTPLAEHGEPIQTEEREVTPTPQNKDPSTNAPITNTLAAKDLQTRTPMSETPSTTEQPSAEPTAKPAPSAPPASATATDEHPSNGTTARAPDKNTTGQSTKPPTIAVENSDDDDDDNNKKEDIYTAIDLQSDRARKDGFTGGSFFLDVDPFADLTITDLTEDIPESVPEAPGSARETGKTTTTNKNAKKLKIQWIRMNLIEVSDGMRHYSVNPLDFMTTAQVRECFKAAQGQSHKLGKLKKILVEAGWKMLVRAVHEGADPKRRAAFIKHGVRSALEVAGSPLNGAITCYSFTKEKYDWHLIVLTKEAFEALENIRSLLDPRTGVLLLFRPYSPQPYQSQTFTYEGIIDDDDTEEMKAKAIEDFRTLADAHYKANNFPLSVGKIEPTPTKRSPNQMSVEFVFDDPRRASILRPEMLPQAYHSWSGKRKLNVYWPSKCRACGSESHRGPMKECPWLSYEAHGVTVSRSAARMYFPGQTASAPPKRKRQDPEEDELLDMRPEGPKAKKQKTTESEPTEKESKGKEKEKQIEDVQMADN